MVTLGRFADSPLLLTPSANAQRTLLHNYRATGKRWVTSVFHLWCILVVTLYGSVSHATHAHSCMYNAFAQQCVHAVTSAAHPHSYTRHIHAVTPVTHSITEVGAAPNLVVPTCRCGNTGGTIYTNMLHSSAGLNESTVDSATCRNAIYNKSKWQTKSVHIQCLSSTFSLAQNADSLINQAPHINTCNESSMYYKTSTLTINL